MIGYVTYTELLSFGISESYLKKALCYYRQKKSQSWENIKDFNDKRKVWIKLETIPKGTKEKYNIPTAEQLQAIQEKEQSSRANLLSNPVAAKLQHAFSEAYGGYLQLYWDRLAYSQENQIKLSTQYAKEHAYWVQMVHLTGTLEKTTYGKVSECFKIHKELIKNEVVLQSNITSLVRFKVKLKTIRQALYMGEDAVEQIIHNGLKDNKEGTKVKDFHRALIMAYLQYEQIYPYRVVADLVNHHCELKGYKTISESSIKQLMSSDNKFRTLVDAYRYGKNTLMTKYCHMLLGNFQNSLQMFG
ncbi:hypothetical protein ACFSKN_08170 [Mariniflexile gromovii]|uniref:Uncharacterized protein n=1 Tax=Mariniflexile gromovii TaxID=362523 RepID=A0ABS4BUA1_9FLAO|nr:hypothetical protein [Mariniflexile gromovii]MBP0904173.1 hypothetical protein [Mariniflexile gromovii]